MMVPYNENLILIQETCLIRFCNCEKAFASSSLMVFPKGRRVVNTGVQKELVNEPVAINVCADLASKCRMAQMSLHNGLSN
ncbi:unnamed protein product [Sphagnum balticum]